MICRECGARIEDDVAECKFCGAQYGVPESVPEPVEPIETETETEPTAVPEETYGVVSDAEAIEEILDENEIKRRNQIEKMREEKQSQLEEIEKRRKSRRNKRRRNVLLIILFVLLLGVAVAAGVYYISPAYNGNDGDEIIIVTPSPEPKPVVTPEPVETETPAPEETEEPEPEETPIPAEDEQDIEPEDIYVTPEPVVTRRPVVTQKPVVVKPSVKTTKLTNARITGGEVIKANGKSYMSFLYNNKWYYANVSDNTTTKFIAWKPMTINAYNKGETYKGVPVYTITKITHHNNTQTSSVPTSSVPTSSAVQTNGYIISDSSSRLISESELQGMSVRDLRRARNEIYARHGRTFNDDSLQSYFNSCSWYKPNSSYNYANENANLNEIEKQNIITIRNYEKR